MKQRWIQEEQTETNRVIAEVESIIGELDRQQYRPVDVIQAKREENRLKKLTEYAKALPNPYIGKLELIEGDKISVYRIGKHGVENSDFQTIVYNWKTPLGSAYYAFAGGDGQVPVTTPEGVSTFHVRRKRSITVDNRIVSDVRESYSDLYLGDDRLEQEDEDQDPILRRLLQQRSGDHQLREIIATIQKEQNEIIRLGIAQPILVQGVAGSGKTSIALHRVSYLLYQYQNQLQADQILVLAPNKIFLNYMREILTELDIEGIEQATIGELTKRVLPYIDNIRPAQYWLDKAIQEPGSDEEWGPIIRYKTSMSFHNLADRYMARIADEFLPENVPSLTDFSEEPLNLADTFRNIYNGYRHLPLHQRQEETITSIRNWLELELVRQRKLLEERYARFKREWTAEIDDSFAVKAEAEAKLMELAALKVDLQKQEWNKAIASYLKGWKKLDMFEIYGRLCRKETLAELDESISAVIAEGMEQEGKRANNARWKLTAYEDIGILMFLEQAINGLPPIRFDYMVIDEAQDYYPFLQRMLRELARSVTLLGDVTQSIYSWTGIEDWSELDDVFEHNLHRLDLGVSYRSTMEIMEVANRILANNSIGVKAIVPVQHSGPKPLFTEVSDFQDLLEKLDGAITAFLEQGYSRIAIIAKDPRLCEAFYTEYCAFHGASTVQFIQHAEDELKSSVIFISAALVKGLEFDAVIIPSTYGDSLLDARLLFVSVSRAQEALHLLYHQYPGPLQEPLTAHDAPISFTNKEG